MDKKYQLMVDPTPAGWAYGFPRPLPEEAVGGTGYDLWCKSEFDLGEWVCSFGYPEESFQYVRYYPQEVAEEYETSEKMGDMKFTTAGDFMKDQDGDIDLDKFVYPGSDPQE
jgi:hypothetical protein